MEIETVKISGNGWLVNGNTNVPNNEGNRHYKMVKKWIDEGNTPAPDFTEQQLNDQADEKDYQEWKTKLNAQNETALRARYKQEKEL